MQFLSLCLCHALYIHCTFMISDLYLVCQIWWVNPTVHVHFQITTCLTPLLILAPLTEQCDMGNKQPSVWCWDQTQACLCAVNQCSAIHQSGWGAQREPSAVNNPPPPPLRLSLMYTNIFPCKALQYQHVLEQKASWRLKNKSVHMCACARSHKCTLTVFVNATRDYSGKKGIEC